MIKSFIELPAYVLWGLSLHRNQALFEGKKCTPRLVAHCVRVAFKERKKYILVIIVKHHHTPHFNHDSPW